MKKRNIILMTTLLLAISVCAGCGAENTATEETETATVATTEEDSTEQTEEATVTPEETAEPTLEVKEEPSEETTTEFKLETTKTAGPESTEEPQAIYTYTDMSATMYAQQTVNVRDLPDTSGNKLGSLSTNDEIIISAKCNETGWYMFEYNGSVAFVSNEYVEENKVEVQQQTTANSDNLSSTANNSCPYTLWQPVDEGDKIWWYVTQPDPNWETSGHKETQAWMMDTICDRGVANSGGFVPEGYYGYAANEWIFMGTYSEGNVYYQSFYYATNPR